ncbi:MAG: prepilin-type N-terminal cleavage/methylation domain-containing protein [Moorella sp. (in: Bacteria)]|nr:prepilin-type N-terminal cleavage/methylation domain-containing protein [Moorella sp. (in: firmicutes)]
MKMRRFLRRRVLGNNKGFTLLELLAVIALIGILAGLVVPRVASSQSDAKSKTVEANVQMLQAAVERYHFDNGSYPSGSDEEWIDELHPDYISADPDKIKDSGNYSLSADGVVSGTRGTP